jgi:hypothetical protein
MNTPRVSSCLAFVFLAAAASAPAQAAEPSSCVACHGDAELFGEEMVQIVEQWRQGVHASVELGCHDCHGGNPDPSLGDDAEAAMDPGFAPAPYLGVPPRTAIPGLCGRCHSDPEFMKRYDPGARVDQEREYWTSHHGRALREGDSNVATCVDCHGTHGILRADNTRSPVYPTRVAETCGGCHSDPERMAGYTLPDGRPLPVNQQVRWRRSVHAASMFEREDLSAPTCNDCHGNHGATPPGLESIAFVCGQCHGREADLFRGSPKHDGFLSHNEYLADAGEARCAACHEPPASGVTEVAAFSECVTCHGNHAVVRPTVVLLEPLPSTPCAFCHEPIGPLAEAVPEPEGRAANYARVLGELTRELADLEGEALFNALVEPAQQLEHHTRPGATDEMDRVLRPEFERLFTKFRIGTTTYTYPDPVTGEPVTERVVRCGDCHSQGPEASAGGAAGAELVRRMRELTALTARAERIVLNARRGGVQVGPALDSIDRAVDAQIELEVLVHAFDVSEGSAFLVKHAEGLEHAEAALNEGQRALDQLAFRRMGLAVSLVFIGLVLVGLALKIRQLGGSR